MRGRRPGQEKAIEEWLAGMGLERYAEALLEAGWDCGEVLARLPCSRFFA